MKTEQEMSKSEVGILISILIELHFLKQRLSDNQKIKLMESLNKWVLE